MPERSTHCRIPPAALVLALSLLHAGAARAHAFLQTATPAVGSTTAQAPAQVVITFTEGVEPAFSTIAVQDAHGASMAAGIAHAQGDATRLAVPLRPLPPGRYKVTWHATATDTHKTQGDYSFTVAP